MSAHGAETGIILVYTLYGDLTAAEAAAEDMVRAGLAACANILSPARSCYLWNAVYETQTEYPVLFKTSRDRRQALMTRIEQSHGYELPAVLSWEAGATPAYALWVDSSAGMP